KRMAAYAGDSLRAGDVDGAIRFALQAIPGKQDIFTPPVTAEAQKALTDALQVYDLSDGFKAHKTVELPAAPLYLALSPDGKTAACVYAWSVVLFDTDSAEILAEFPAVHSALAEVHFSDNDIVVYAGNVGLEAYDIRKGRKLWTTNRLATSIALSADCRYIATVYSEESTAFIYNAVDGQIIREVRFDGKNQRTAANASFANPGDNLLALSPDGALLAVSFADGSLWIYDLRDRENDLELFDAASGYTRFEGGFHKQYFAFTASGPSGSVFAVVDTAEQAQTGGFSSSGRFSVQTDETGIYVQTDNLLVKLDPVTGEQSPLVATAEYITNFARSDGYTLMTSKEELLFFDRRTNLVSRHALLYSGAHVQIAEGTAVAGSLDSPVLRIWKLENHIEAGIFSYDPDYRHDEARISADGRSVMLFSYGGFRLYDINGAILAETEIPDAEQLYDQQYRRDEAGSRLEVIYNDGTIRAYSAEDGSLRYEVAGMAPDLSLYEEFFPDTLRFTSPLHGTPAAYDRKSGRLVRELEKDAYLTYVTQAGEYIVTEYVTADGARYGLLLNERCETLAYLPNLCDILGDRLIFDYPSGSLRESRIYDLDELIGLARR
ncbi:MAG: WD40 repeat domain-containing protein, partial [Clostridiales bacterium]|nr:WD40 repeat domain-containing protein [Clostridiales bacterium]